MKTKDKLLAAIEQMTELEIENLYNNIPKRFLKTYKQQKCIHSMRYQMQTGGMTCTKCGWMS